jgi:hypothetical protein
MRAFCHTRTNAHVETGKDMIELDHSDYKDGGGAWSATPELVHPFPFTLAVYIHPDPVSPYVMPSGPPMPLPLFQRSRQHRVDTIPKKRTGVFKEDDRIRVMPVDHVVNARRERTISCISEKAHI